MLSEAVKSFNFTDFKLQIRRQSQLYGAGIEARHGYLSLKGEEHHPSIGRQLCHMIAVNAAAINYFMGKNTLQGHNHQSIRINQTRASDDAH